MSLCTPTYHRWDAQKMLAKGGVEDGDPCDCGAVRFAMRDDTRSDDTWNALVRCQAALRDAEARAQRLEGALKDIMRIALTDEFDEDDAPTASGHRLNDMYVAAKSALAAAPPPEAP
jgi:hypothetical protein